MAEHLVDGRRALEDAVAARDRLCRRRQLLPAELEQGVWRGRSIGPVGLEEVGDCRVTVAERVLHARGTRNLDGSEELLRLERLHVGPGGGELERDPRPV